MQTIFNIYYSIISLTMTNCKENEKKDLSQVISIVFNILVQIIYIRKIFKILHRFDYRRSLPMLSDNRYMNNAYQLCNTLIFMVEEEETVSKNFIDILKRSFKLKYLSLFQLVLYLNPADIHKHLMTNKFKKQKEY